MSSTVPTDAANLIHYKDPKVKAIPKNRQITSLILQEVFPDDFGHLRREESILFSFQGRS